MPSVRTRRAIPLTALAVVLMAALVAGAGPVGGQEKGGEGPAPAVVVTPAEIMDLRERARFTGRLKAIQKVDIRARVAGFVEHIDFEEGAKVGRGDVLYRIEEDAYRAAVKEIRGQINAAKAKLELAEIQRERKETLVRRETVAQSELDVALADLGRIQGEIQALEGQLARARLQLSYTRVNAPFDGVIGLSAVDVGAFVGPEAGALTTLTRLDPMTAEFPVATAQLLDYRARTAREDGPPQANVELTLANGQVYPHKGEIDFIDAQVAPGTDTVTVRARFPNPDGVLLDGALVSVSLEQAEAQMVLGVPRRAVQRDQQGAFVLVVDGDSKVELRRVEIIRTTNGFSVVAEGLKEGERVITEGVNKVRPGITVDAARATGG